MEMSTLTTNLIQEQFMSEHQHQHELNNNNNEILCANDTSAKLITTSANVVVYGDDSKTSNPEPSSDPVVTDPAPVPVDSVPLGDPVPVETDTNSLLLPPLIEMPSDPNQGNEMLQNLPKDTSISFPDVSAQTLDENQEVKMVLPDAADPTSLLNPNATSLLTDPLRTPPRPMIEDRTTVTGE